MKNQLITVDSIVIKNSDIAFSRLDDDLLAIDAQAGYCYSMNETAGRIWDLINAPVSVSALCSQLTKEFTVDEHTCLVAIIPVLQELAQSGLIRIQSIQTDTE